MIGAILFCVLICLYAFWSWKVHLKGTHELPPLYPGMLPIIGHLHVMVGDGISLWRTIKELTAEAMKQGGVIGLFLGTKLYYFISDPEDALTAANACLQKHFTYDYAKPWLGDGLITASGETWKRHRKLLTPAFSLPVMYGFLDIFNTQSRQFVENLKHEVGKRFDHTVYLRNIALETFCQLHTFRQNLANISLSGFESRNRFEVQSVRGNGDLDLAAVLHVVTAFGISGFEDKNFIQKYMHATDNILSIVTSRFQNFWLQSDFIFKLSGLQKKQNELVKIVNDMSDKVIKRKKAARDNNEGEYLTKTSGIRYKPFLDLLLELSEDNALTDKEIREEVDTAIVTGFDTTSSLLGYIMILLGTHPKVQDTMYEEIKEVFETDRDVEKEDFQKLVYMEAVIKESLRVFTTGPVTLRYVDRDVKLKNYTMRAGSQCVVLLYGAHRDPVWGKDAEKFRPERWLNTDMPANPAAFVGFSLGKRSCLGKTYAMISMKTTLVHFLKRYKISADDSNLKLRFDFLLKPVSGHEISLEERL